MCELFGKSRQAYYQKSKRQNKQLFNDELIIQEIDRLRKKSSGIGGRKLYKILRESMPEHMQTGRDAFFDLLRRHNRLIRRRRTSVRTTNSNHWLRRYPNLITDFTPTSSNRLWVSDITYIQTTVGFSYLFLITDAYSRKIVGWEIADTLEGKHAVKALKKALHSTSTDFSQLIHHSDRGVQYCCDAYTRELIKRNATISMTENGDPLENAIAERVNGILKMEWLNQEKLKDLGHAQKRIKQIIDAYNNIRPHLSIEMMTPQQAHNCKGELKRMWKNYYKQNKKQKHLN